MDGIPPTQAALLQHIKRSAYQAGHCWGQMMIASPELPSPSELLRCGCKRERGDAEDTVNVEMQEFSVPICASALDCVQSMLTTNNENSDIM